MNSSVIDIVSSVLDCAGYSDINIAQTISGITDISVVKKHVRPRILNESGTAYVCFEYKGQSYKTVLRGLFQAINAAYCIDVFERLNTKGFRITREHIDKGLLSVELNGRFETIVKKPLVIFDVVQTAEDMKNFCANIDDYFGRSVQKSQITPLNLHPKPFKKLVICDWFAPPLCKIKQNMTIIFTNTALQKAYHAVYNGVVKTMVIDFDNALPYAMRNYPEHKIFIIGSYDLYQRAKTSLD